MSSLFILSSYVSILLFITVVYAKDNVIPLSLFSPFPNNQLTKNYFVTIYGISSYLAYLLFSDSFLMGSIIILISFGLPLFIIDSLYYILPDKLVGSLFLTFIYHCLMYSPYPIHFHIFSSLLVFILFILLSLFYPNSLGGGDIKLLSAIAFLIGFQKSLETLFLSSILGILFYFLAKKDQNTPLPFGPFILISSLIILLI